MTQRLYCDFYLGVLELIITLIITAKNSITDARTPQSRKIALVKQYKDQETFRIDSVTFVKVQEIITCKRANIYVRQSIKTRQFNSKTTALISKLK